MSISAEATSSRIIVSIIGEEGTQYVLQRAFYTDKTWLTLTESGYTLLTDEILPKLLTIGDFIDSYELKDGLYEYRIINADLFNNKTEGNEWEYSPWVKFGNIDKFGYSFGNYKVPDGKWGEVITPDDARYTYLWGTDFKATNGEFFTDEQIKYFIDEATQWMERQLNITIKKRVIKSQAKERGLKKTTEFEKGDYTDEESLYDFSFRKIQRYGMITTGKRPIIDIEKFELIYKGGQRKDLKPHVIVDRKKGVIKFTDRPYKLNQTFSQISESIGMYGAETFNPYLFYAIDYTAGYENSDEVPSDLRQMIGKVAAISLLNIIGDGLMSGFSSSSLSMDGISESFSSTQSATSAYFGARIAVYQKEVENYIKENKHKFGFIPIGVL